MAGALRDPNAPPWHCHGCGGLCDGTTQDCTLDSYYANPANGARPPAAHRTLGPRPSASGGTSQNPVPASAAGSSGYGPWFPFGSSYPATRYDDEHSVPTERLPAPVLKCECGSGDSARSGAHSHWCPCWVAP